MFIPSIQQKAFFDWIQTGTGSAILEAVAGSGKTTTLLEALALMQGKIYFGAYNKKISAELEARVPKELTNIKVSTLHAAGFGALKKIAPNAVLNNSKLRELFRAYSTSDKALRPLEGPVTNLVSYAKQAAVGITSPATDDSVWLKLIDHFNVDTDGKTAQVLFLAKAILAQSTFLCTKEVDFDDMIYYPLLKKAIVGTYDWVLIDEAQDTNETRRLLALAMLKEGGRLVAVGDKNQAIYGFTGADSNALDLIQEATGAVCMPLSVSYRCPTSVVEQAQAYVPHIEAHEDAVEGVVRHLPSIKNLFQEVTKGDVVLCRYNAPLVELAYTLILKGVAAKIEGRDIGANLKSLANKWKSKDFATYIERLDNWKNNEIKKHKEAGKNNLVEATQDKVACLKTIIQRVKAKGVRGMPCDLLCAEIDAIFGEVPSEGYVILSSIHKAKGMEWLRVFWLVPEASKRPMQDWEVQTELNLCYVAITRARWELITIPIVRNKSISEDIELEEGEVNTEDCY